MLLFRYLDKPSLCSRSFSPASINVFDWTLLPVYFLNVVVAAMGYEPTPQSSSNHVQKKNHVKQFTTSPGIG